MRTSGHRLGHKLNWFLPYTNSCLQHLERFDAIGLHGTCCCLLLFFLAAVFGGSQTMMPIDRLDHIGGSPDDARHVERSLAFPEAPAHRYGATHAG